MNDNNDSSVRVDLDQLSMLSDRAQTIISELPRLITETTIRDDIERDGVVPDSFVMGAAKVGLFGMHIPVEYGGMGLPFSDCRQVIECVAALDLTLAAFSVLQFTCAEELLAGVNPDAPLLSRIARGELIACLAMSEPNAGSDFYGIRTTATPEEDGWVISGEKCWVSCASVAGVILTFAREDGPQPKISCFAVPSETPGIEVGPSTKNLGVQGLDLRSITLSNVRVGRSQFVRSYPMHERTPLRGLQIGRILVGAIGLGVLKRSAQMMLRFTSNRFVNTGRLLENPAALLMLEANEASVTAMEDLQAVVSRQLDAGLAVPWEMSLVCKIAGSELAWDAIDNVVQLMGARGLDDRNSASKLLRDARFLRIAEGPNEALTMSLGASLFSEDGQFTDFVGHLSEACRTKLADVVSRVRKQMPRPTNLAQHHQAYLTLGGLGLWLILEAALQECKQTRSWVRHRFDMALRAAEFASDVAPNRNRPATVAGKIAMYDRSIGELDEFLATSGSTPDPLLMTYGQPIASSASVASTSDNQQEGAPAVADSSEQQTIASLFANCVRNFPDGVAVAAEERDFSYAALDEISNGVSRHLQQRGATPNDVVALCMGRRADLITAIVAVSKIGGAILLLNPRHPVHRNRLLMECADAKIILTESGWGHQFAHLSDRFVCMDLLDVNQLDTSALTHLAEPDSTAFVTFTSGSTGTPKGIRVSNRALSQQLLWRNSEFGLGQQDRILYSSSPTFDVALWELCGFMACGGSVVLSGDDQFAWEPSEMVRLMHRHHVTCIQLTPRQLDQILNEPLIDDCGELQRVFVGGELLGQGVRQKYHRKLNAALIHLYGPAEAVIDATFWRVEPNSPHSEKNIGKPVPGKRIYILDESLNMCPPGQAGEIYISGAGLSNGYLDPTLAPPDLFLDDPFTDSPLVSMYKSGDMGMLATDGSIEFLGRGDRQVKVNGVRVELDEIGLALEAHSQVSEACVISAGLHGSAQRHHLTAYYVPQGNDKGLEIDLRQWIAERLPKEMMPTSFVRLDSLPRTSSGKIDYQAFTAPSTSPSFAMPSSDSVAGAIREIWSEVLGIGEIAMEDDFFAIGGDSLSSVMVCTQMSARFSIDVASRDLAASPTIESLANRLNARMRITGRTNNSAPVRVHRDNRIPLSGTQSNLWFLQQSQLDSPAYNCPEATRLRGALQYEQLEWALNAVVSRHESLRTRFDCESGVPYQVVSSPGESPFRLDIVDLSSEAAEGREALLAIELQKEASRPFDLSAGAAVAAKLFKLSDVEHVLFWNMHHIVADGWSSSRVFTRELGEIYSAKCKGKSVALGGARIQPIDYMYWADSYLEPEREKQLDFWTRELEDCASSLDLTLGQEPDATDGTKEARRIPLNLHAETFERIRDFAASRRVSVFDVLMASCSLLMHLLSGEEDVVVGTVVANRLHSSIDNVIGNFANVCAVRSQLGDNRPLHRLVEDTHWKLRDVLDSSELPFSQVVSAVRPQRAKDRNPLFNVLLSFYNGKKHDLEMDGLLNEDVECYPSLPRFDLSFDLRQGVEGISGHLEYATNALAADSAERIAAYFLLIVDQVVSSPHLTLSELQLADHAERIRMDEWNDTAAPFPADMCMHNMFEAQVERSPQSVAVTSADGGLTYAALNKSANQLARFLIAAGVSPEEPVGMCMAPSSENVAALLGVAKAGAVYVPLDPAWPHARIESIVADLGMKVVLCDDSLSAMIEPLGVNCIRVQSQWEAIQEEAEDNLDLPRNPNSGVYIIHTSGSSGAPKGVRTLHRNVAALVSNTNYMDCDATDVFALVNNLAFDISTWEIWSPLVCGASVVIVPQDVKLAPAKLPRFIVENGVTMLYLPTALFHAIAKEVPNAFRTLSLLVVGGEALDPERARDVISSGPPKHFVNAYGPTEVTCNAACFDVGTLRANATRVPIGKPIQNSQFYVLGKHQNLLPIGAIGELYIGGAGVSGGYHNREARTAESFIAHELVADNREHPKLYKSGDRVRHLPNGDLEFLGRFDHQVKIRGFRIELGEIEAALKSHQGVRDTAVIARNGPGGSRQLVAFLVLEEPPVAIADIERVVAKLLPQYMIPAAMVALEALPLTANGKVNRRKLSGIDVAFGGDQLAGSPRSVLEHEILQMWESILGFGGIGVHTNFFDAGGDSLQAIELVSEIGRRYSVELPFNAMFQPGTVASLALLVNASPGTVIPEKLAVPLSAPAANLTDERPLFLVHPLSGNVLCYLQLAAALNYPVVGLQQDNKQSEEHSIAQIAEQLLPEVLALQPEGEFHLGGWSFGGLVAVELSRLLEQAGRHVKRVMLFDSLLPSSAPETQDRVRVMQQFLEATLQQLGIEDRVAVTEIPDQSDPETLFRATLAFLRERGAMTQDATEAYLQQMLEASMRNIRAFNSYSPSPISSDIVYFASTETNEDMGLIPSRGSAST